VGFNQFAAFKPGSIYQHDTASSFFPWFPPFGEEHSQESEEEFPETEEESYPVGWQELALGVAVMHPDWTAQQIADAVGVNRGTLYRSRLFRLFRKRFREHGRLDFLADLPRGAKQFDPDNERAGAQLEAWDEVRKEEADEEE
jgi:hypothetical protein